MDALTHAIEGVTSTEWNPHGDAFALQAIRADPRQPGARGRRHHGRGRPREHAGRREPGDRAHRRRGATGLTHSMSHPCGGRFGVPHGVANAINLPWVIEFNAAGDEATPTATASSPSSWGGCGRRRRGGAGARRSRSGAESRLGSRAGSPRSACPRRGSRQLVEGAMGDGCTLVNPRELTEEDFKALFRQAL